jgi:GLPGLI family protein
MDEVRMIANYKCRKAVGKICDSVYVVAFYTEDIIASGGPEMFSGLPGMILELAIPRLYSTWIATKVEVGTPKKEDLTPPEKGKKVTQKEMYDTLMASISKWGNWAQRSIWWSML